MLALKQLKRQVIPAAKPVRWLNNLEWSAWLQLLATFTLLPAAIDSSLQRRAGMTHFEFGVMAALSRQPGRRLQLKDLAVLANGSLSRLSHVISRVERQGWVRRVSGANGRATNAELTDKGYRKLMEAGPIHFQEVNRTRLHQLSVSLVGQFGVCRPAISPAHAAHPSLPLDARD